jgi:predicted nucleic acid-binding protein
MTGKVYVDSNILIYYADGSSKFQLPARSILRTLKGDSAELISSEITVGECLRGAYRSDPEFADTFLQTLLDKDFITLIPVAFPVIKRAAFLGAELNMKLLDAIHVATAESLGCDIFLTNDRGIRTPAGIELRYLTAEP